MTLQWTEDYIQRKEDETHAHQSGFFFCSELTVQISCDSLVSFITTVSPAVIENQSLHILVESLTQSIFLHNFKSGMAFHFKSILFILGRKKFNLFIAHIANGINSL